MLFNNKLTKQLKQGLTLFNHSSNQVKKVEKKNFDLKRVTEVYDQREPLYEFATRLKGFPNGLDKIIHSAGEKDSYSYFEMTFYSIDITGKVGVLVTLEENVSTEYRENEKDKLKLELIVEPASIDVFQKELQTLAANEEGKARLNGIK